MLRGALVSAAIAVAASSLAGCADPVATPGARFRGRPVRPEVLPPDVVAAPIRPPRVDPPALVPVTVLPTVVRGPRQALSYRQENAVVDVLWIVDSSASMIVNRTRLAAQFDRFLAVLIGANVDFHIGVTATDLSPTTGDQGRLHGPVPWIDRTTANPAAVFRTAVTYANVRGNVLDEGLAAMNRALTAPNITGPNRGFIREQASLAVIVVADGDDESAGPPGFFVRFLRGMKGPGRESSVRLSAIAGDLPDGCTPAGQEDVFGARAEAGRRYIEVATSTGGIVDSICTADFGPLVDALARSLTALRREFPLSAPPVEMTIEVTVNGVRVTKNAIDGWSYLPSQRAVRFNGRAIPPPGADVRIFYDVAS